MKFSKNDDSPQYSQKVKVLFVLHENEVLNCLGNTENYVLKHQLELNPQKFLKGGLKDIDAHRFRPQSGWKDIGNNRVTIDEEANNYSLNLSSSYSTETEELLKKIPEYDVIVHIVYHPKDLSLCYGTTIKPWKSVKKTLDACGIPPEYIQHSQHIVLRCNYTRKNENTQKPYIRHLTEHDKKELLEKLGEEEGKSEIKRITRLYSNALDLQYFSEIVQCITIDEVDINDEKTRQGKTKEVIDTLIKIGEKTKILPDIKEKLADKMAERICKTAYTMAQGTLHPNNQEYYLDKAKKGEKLFDKAKKECLKLLDDKNIDQYVGYTLRKHNKSENIQNTEELVKLFKTNPVFVQEFATLSQPAFKKTMRGERVYVGKKKLKEITVENNIAPPIMLPTRQETLLLCIKNLESKMEKDYHTNMKNEKYYSPNVKMVVPKPIQNDIGKSTFGKQNWSDKIEQAKNNKTDGQQK